MPTLGYDIFYTEPESDELLVCQICDTICDSQKNILGPTSYIESIQKKSHLHDKFICPYSEKEWHKKALELFHFLEKLPSEKLKKIVQEELNEIIKSNT